MDKSELIILIVAVVLILGSVAFRILWLAPKPPLHSASVGSPIAGFLQN
jgi:hypothetical protein